MTGSRDFETDQNVPSKPPAQPKCGFETDRHPIAIRYTQWNVFRGENNTNSNIIIQVRYQQGERILKRDVSHTFLSHPQRSRPSDDPPTSSAVAMHARAVDHLAPSEETIRLSPK